MGRPRIPDHMKHISISIAFPPSLLIKLSDSAKESGRSLSAEVRQRLLMSYMNVAESSRAEQVEQLTTIANDIARMLREANSNGDHA